MTESEFNDAVDDMLMVIEEVIEDCGADIDFENVAGILTLSFENGSKVIINRQTPVKQIWVAAKSGGYHCDYDPDRDAWFTDSDKEELFALLSRVCSEQANDTVVLLKGD